MNDARLAIIFKKGNTDLPENYRPIALLNVTYKLLASIIQKRLSDHMDTRIDKEQYGFRKSKSTAQPLFILRRTQEIQEEAALECHLLLLDWEKAFDKVHQNRMLQAIARLGIPDKMTRMISAIYEAPNYVITDKGTTTRPRIQKSGIRQGCPLSPYLFIMLMTVIMHDVDSGMTEAEKENVEANRLHKEVSSRLFYADDTIIMSQTAEAAEIVLHRIQQESHKYALKLNETKCTHLQMNAIQRIRFDNGTSVPTKTQTEYLGGKIKNDSSYKMEIQSRIGSTWATLRKLDLFWNKSPSSMKWKIIVYDAVIVTKLLYGLASVPLTRADCNKIDAFQMRGLRKILKIKHPYWSRVSNNQILRIANEKLDKKDNEIQRLSQRLIKKQITLYAHILRESEEDPMKKISINENGSRVKADFRRAGRPRTKWHDTVRKRIIIQLTTEGILPQDPTSVMTKDEINHIIQECAEHRIL